LKPKITFFNEEIKFNLSNKTTIRNWLVNITSSYGFTINTLNYIFCSDDYLHKINIQFLNHDTLTDIITFDNSIEPKTIESDIFISIDRVKENALEFEKDFEEELRRVLVHGALHLCGLKDKSKKDKLAMREAEENALNDLVLKN
jgi:rRNA maturation RNase YbeY